MRLDLRRPGLMAVETALLDLPGSDVFCAMARPSGMPQPGGALRSSPYAPQSHLLAATTSTSVLLLDVRHPETPLLMWRHNTPQHPPHLLRLSLSPPATAAAAWQGHATAPLADTTGDRAWERRATQSQRLSHGGHGSSRQDSPQQAPADSAAGASGRNRWIDDLSDSDEDPEGDGIRIGRYAGLSQARMSSGGPRFQPGGNAWLTSQHDSIDPDLDPHAPSHQQRFDASQPNGTQASQMYGVQGQHNSSLRTQSAGRAGSLSEAPGTPGLILFANAARGDVHIAEFVCSPPDFEACLEQVEAGGDEEDAEDHGPASLMQAVQASLQMRLHSLSRAGDRDASELLLAPTTHPQLPLPDDLQGFRGPGAVAAVMRPRAGWRVDCCSTAHAVGLPQRLGQPLSQAVPQAELAETRASRSRLYINEAAERFCAITVRISTHAAYVFMPARFAWLAPHIGIALLDRFRFAAHESYSPW